MTHEEKAAPFFGRRFTAHHTGGNCWGWIHEFSDGTHILITDGNFGLYHGGPEWIVGHYDNNGSCIGYVSNDDSDEWWPQ